MNTMDSRELEQKITDLQEELEAEAAKLQEELEAEVTELQEELEEVLEADEEEQDTEEDDNTMDSREIEVKIEDLQERINYLDLDMDDIADVKKLPESSERDELITLLKFRDEVSGYNSEWRYGIQFIADKDFEEYAKEVANDIGAVPRDVSWPCNCIDWYEAAYELKMDYSSADLEGTTYWYRS